MCRGTIRLAGFSSCFGSECGVEVYDGGGSACSLCGRVEERRRAVRLGIRLMRLESISNVFDGKRCAAGSRDMEWVLCLDLGVGIEISQF